MKVQKKRWGEVTIKKQGEGKNKFDMTKSFSVEQTTTAYTIEQYQEILQLVTDLTERISFNSLKKTLQEQKGI